jgi:hypothetical protein
MKTLYITKKRLRIAGINLNQYPSSGQYPSAIGMKKFWGKNSLTIKSGCYLYLVPDNVYYLFCNKNKDLKYANP